MYFFLIRLFTIERKADKLPIDWIRSIGAEILWKFFLIFKSFFSGGRNWQKIPESLMIKKKQNFISRVLHGFFLLWLYFKRWYHNCLFLCCFSDTSNTSIRFRLYRNFERTLQYLLPNYYLSRNFNKYPFSPTPGDILIYLFL